MSLSPPDLAWLSPGIEAALDAVIREGDGSSVARLDADAQSDAATLGARGLLIEAAEVMACANRPVASGWCRWLRRLLDEGAPRDVVWQGVELFRPALSLWRAGLPECPDIVHRRLSVMVMASGPSIWVPRLSMFLDRHHDTAIPRSAVNLAQARAHRTILKSASAQRSEQQRALVEISRLLPALRSEAALLLAVDRVPVAPPIEQRDLWWRRLDSMMGTLLHDAAGAAPPVMLAPSVRDAWWDEVAEWLLPNVLVGSPAETVVAKVIPGWRAPTIEQRTRMEDGLRGCTPDVWAAYGHAFVESADALGAPHLDVLSESLEGAGFVALSRFRADAPSETVAQWRLVLSDPWFWLHRDPVRSLAAHRNAIHARAWHDVLSRCIEAATTTPLLPHFRELLERARAAWSASAAAPWRVALDAMLDTSQPMAEERLAEWLAAWQAWLLDVATDAPGRADWFAAMGGGIVTMDCPQLPALPDPVVVTEIESETDVPPPSTTPAVTDIIAPDLMATLWSEVRQHHNAWAAWLRMSQPSLASRKSLLASMEVIQGALDYLPPRPGRATLDTVVRAFQALPPWQPVSPGLRNELERAYAWVADLPEMVEDEITPQAWRDLCRIAVKDIMYWARLDQPTPRQWAAIKAFRRLWLNADAIVSEGESHGRA